MPAHEGRDAHSIMHATDLKSIQSADVELILSEWTHSGIIDSRELSRIDWTERFQVLGTVSHKLKFYELQAYKLFKYISSESYEFCV